MDGKKDHTPVLTNSNEWTREPFFPKTCSLKEAKASLDFRHIDSYNWANPVIVASAAAVAVEAAARVHIPYGVDRCPNSGPKPERCVA